MQYAIEIDNSASEVTTIWRYTNVYIIIIIIITIVIVKFIKVVLKHILGEVENRYMCDSHFFTNRVKICGTLSPTVLLLLLLLVVLKADFISLYCR